jgi:acetyl esterase/lipase
MRANTVYGSRANRELHLDIYEPTGPVNHRTAVLALHGGGWNMGAKEMIRPRGDFLSKLGFTVLAAEYRLVSEAPWPAQLHDVKTAIAWTRGNASQLGIDPDKVVVQGHSAGAHLALMAAGTYGRSEFDPDDGSGPQAKVAAVVAYYPPVRLLVGGPPPDFSKGPPTPAQMAENRKMMVREDGSSPVAGMLLGDNATEEAAKAASPLEYLSRDFPPTIIFHGTADGVVHPEASRLLFNSLQGLGVPVELHQIADANHEFDVTPSYGQVSALESALFLRRFVSESGSIKEEIERTNPMAAAGRSTQG